MDVTVVIFTINGVAGTLPLNLFNKNNNSEYLKFACK